MRALRSVALVAATLLVASCSGDSGGGDGPESQTFAVYETVTGRGGTWMGSGPTFTLRSYEGDCLSYGWRVSARRVRRLRADPRTDHPIWVRP